MRKICLLILVLFLTGCSGYKPVFSTKDVNFFINQIIITDNDKISYKIKKKLKPYSSENTNKIKINLSINSSKEVKIIAKDNKGDALMFNLVINSSIEILSNDMVEKKYQFTEKFTFKNQTNKFELDQYKRSLEDELIDKIFEKLILNLRTY
tara:strand:+ start:53 stop:508 length:456 start_codon:yes stop_codon:yes gene_type:complete